MPLGGYTHLEVRLVIGILACGYILLWILPAYARNLRHLGEALVASSMCVCSFYIDLEPIQQSLIFAFSLSTLIQKALAFSQMRSFVGGSRAECILGFLAYVMLLFPNTSWMILAMSLFALFSALFLKTGVVGRSGYHYFRLVSLWIIADTLALFLWFIHPTQEMEWVFLVIASARLLLYPSLSLGFDLMESSRIHFTMLYWRIMPLVALDSVIQHQDWIFQHLTPSMNLERVAVALILLITIIHGVLRRSWYARFLVFWSLGPICFALAALHTGQRTHIFLPLLFMWWLVLIIISTSIRTDEILRPQKWLSLLSPTSARKPFQTRTVIHICVILIGVMVVLSGLRIHSIFLWVAAMPLSLFLWLTLRYAKALTSQLKSTSELVQPTHQELFVGVLLTLVGVVWTFLGLGDRL